MTKVDGGNFQKSTPSSNVLMHLNFHEGIIQNIHFKFTLNTFFSQLFHSIRVGTECGQMLPRVDNIWHIVREQNVHLTPIPVELIKNNKIRS